MRHSWTSSPPPLKDLKSLRCEEKKSPFSLQQTLSHGTDASTKQPPTLKEKIEAYTDCAVTWFFKKKKVGDILNEVEAGILDDMQLLEEYLRKCEVES